MRAFDLLAHLAANPATLQEAPKTEVSVSVLPARRDRAAPASYLATDAACLITTTSTKVNIYFIYQSFIPRHDPPHPCSTASVFCSVQIMIG